MAGTSETQTDCMRVGKATGMIRMRRRTTLATSMTSMTMRGGRLWEKVGRGRNGSERLRGGEGLRLRGVGLD